jgi:hypothetical protein
LGQACAAFAHALLGDITFATSNHQQGSADHSVVCALPSFAHSRSKSGFGSTEAMTTASGSSSILSVAADAGEAGIGGGLWHCKTWRRPPQDVALLANDPILVRSRYAPSQAPAANERLASLYLILIPGLDA